MLVDWLVSFVRRSTRRGFGSCRSFFDVRFRSKKYAGHIFRTESEALAERPAEEGLEGQESRGTRRVEDLNGKESAVAERQLFKPQTVLLRWRGFRGGGSISGDGQTLGSRSGLRRTWVRLGERGRRDPPAAAARRG